MIAPLLVELLTEELPPKALERLSRTFAEALHALLREDGFVAADARFTAFGTPRRLAVLIEGVAAQAPDKAQTVLGPAVGVGLDKEGRPTPALLGFAKKQGVGVDRLTRVAGARGEQFAYEAVVPGGALDRTLDLHVADALRRLPVPKVMRWGAGDAEFVRPAHGLVMLHGDRIVPGEVLGLASGRTTRGHRFLCEGDIDLRHAEDYERDLADKGRVIASFDRRRDRIRELLRSHAGGADIAAGDALLEEVTALVEWPAVYDGHFDKAFLEVPQECLTLTMRQNQKYFPLVDGQGRLLNRFLLVSNMETPHPRNIIHGNERVLRARLADAKFFYDQDRRIRLADRVPALEAVVYHNKLGSQLARAERLERLAGAIALELGAAADLASRAGRLAKADLLTGMVGEFPELQGVMGMYYARHDGEPEAVARAIEAHYRPRFAGDALPADAVGDAVALAEKLDTLAGIWGIGLHPTGDKDPFALRRAALGVVRILVEHALPLDCAALLKLARGGYGATRLADDTVAGLHEFILDRMRSYLRERDFAADEIESVVGQRPVRLDLVIPRLEAVRAFRRLPEAESLAAANKRIRNILQKSPPPAGDRFDDRLLRESAERALHEASQQVEAVAREHRERGEYAEALRVLAALKSPVDAFFDQVLVNAPEAALRTNRLLLLMRLDGAMNEVADISKLAPA
ncbi:MAG: glycine--tRNA ligase subunit beta [Burkholderiales bacterium]|nr:glycine--tRNA ligase subunit beta [Burkholderiales bacterium]